jgi:hypothetical protein
MYMEYGTQLCALTILTLQFASAPVPVVPWQVVEDQTTFEPPCAVSPQVFQRQWYKVQ